MYDIILYDINNLIILYDTNQLTHYPGSPLYPATFHIQGSMVEAIWDAIAVIAEGLLA